MTISIDVYNDNIIIKIKVRYLFNFIDINKTVYESKNNEKKDIKRKRKEKNKLNKIVYKKIDKYIERNSDRYKNIFKTINYKKIVEEIKKLLEKIKLEDLYSNIHISSQETEFIVICYTFINSIYAYLFNLVNCEKIYLNVTPGFDKNIIKIRLNISFRMKIIHIVLSLIKILREINVIGVYIKIKSTKDGENGERNKLNKKPNGYNT